MLWFAAKEGRTSEHALEQALARHEIAAIGNRHQNQKPPIRMSGCQLEFQVIAGRPVSRLTSRPDKLQAVVARDMRLAAGCYFTG
jgi:hypothetical protein